MMALANLHVRTTYRPKTPNRKGSGGSNHGGPSPAPTYRKDSMSSSCYTPTMFDRLGGSRKGSVSPQNSSFGGPKLSRTNSLRSRNGNISFLKQYDHTKETEDTQFIRAATGRGSIKRGPAPTKASVLRQQVNGHYTM